MDIERFTEISGIGGERCGINRVRRLVRTEHREAQVGYRKPRPRGSETGEKVKVSRAFINGFSN